MAPMRGFDRFQQRHKSLAVPIAVIKKFGDDQAGSQAALVAYYAFFSLFPLLLVFLTVLGFVLQGDASAQQSVRNSVLGQFPIVGQKLDVSTLHGSSIALVIGIATSLFAGLGVTQAARNALDRVWAVPMKDAPELLPGPVARAAAAVLARGAVHRRDARLGPGHRRPWQERDRPDRRDRVLAAAELRPLLRVFRLMTSRSVTTRELRGGVIVAAVLWTILQALGGYYIGHVLKGAHGAYAQFGFVIALIVWLHLGAQMTLYAAEINVVLTRRLWPRSLFGPPVSLGRQADAARAGQGRGALGLRARRRRVQELTAGPAAWRMARRARRGGRGAWRGAWRGGRCGRRGRPAPPGVRQLTPRHEV